MDHIVHRLINVDHRYAETSIAFGLQPPGFSIIRLSLVTCSVDLHD
jgi:hypothetical protein